MGTEHEAFLAYLIKNKFSKRVEVHCATEEKYLNDIEKKGNYDLCISNYPLKNVALENLVVVEDIPSAKNWMDIYYCMNQK
nr:hypothetical protein [Enterococcus sp. 9D6_DIV0238]